ncbi:MAG: hypothetical protein R3D34_06805 [Nitratireductor sp.]
MHSGLGAILEKAGEKRRLPRVAAGQAFRDFEKRMKPAGTRQE